MAVFTGSIRLGQGPEEDLETSLTVESGRLIVTAGDHDIGNWAMAELSAERHDGNFHIGVEGEELIVAVADPVGFMQALGIEDRPDSGRRGRSRKPKKKRARKDKEEAPPADPAPPVSRAAAVAQPPPSVLEEQPSGPSWWDRIPLRVKLAGAGVVALVILGIFLPDLLALLLLLAGMVTLFLGIAARSDSGSAIMPPPFFGTTTAAVLGIGLVLLAVVIIAVT